MKPARGVASDGVAPFRADGGVDATEAARAHGAAGDLEAVARLAVEDPAVARDFEALEQFFPKRDKRAVALRSVVWSAALDALAGDAAATVAIATRAIAARDRGVLARLAAHLGTASAVDEPHCSLLRAEALYIAGDTEAAAEVFAAARRRASRHPKAIGGALAAAVDVGDLGTAAERAEEIVSGPSSGRVPEPVRRFVSASVEEWGRDRSGQTLEVVVFAHATGKLRENAHLGPPGVGLLETAITSFRETFRPLPEHRITVFLDRHDSDMSAAFEVSVRAFCEAGGLGLVVNRNAGLRTQWLSAFERAEADLVMVIEQDHLFLPGAPRHRGILRVFAERPDVAYVRLNRRGNARAHFDLALVEAPVDRAVAVCRTARFSNTPHVLRRSTFDNILKPVIGDPRFDGRNGGAGGVEENINRLLAQCDRVLGVPATIALLGNAIYGRIGKGAMTRHLGL